MRCSTLRLASLILLVLFIVAPGATVASDINEPGVDTSEVKLEAFSHSVEIVYVYRSGNTTVMIATINPHVLFSYRNVHLIRFVAEPPGKGLALFDEIVESPRPAIGILYQRANALRSKLASIGIDSPLRIEGLFVVVDLSGKPVDLVARVVWEVFRDLNTTVIILDEKLANVRRIYSDIYEYYAALPRNASEYAEQIRAIIVQAEKSSEKIQGCRIWTAGHGYAISPLDGYEYPYLGKVIVNNTYNNCKPVIDRFVVEMADLIRKYISEDIPMYVVLYEHSWIELPLETPILVEMPRTVEMPSEPNYSLQQAIGALLVVTAVTTIATVIVRRRVK
jgi:hypothetical protein